VRRPDEETNCTVNNKDQPISGSAYGDHRKRWRQRTGDMVCSLDDQEGVFYLTFNVTCATYYITRGKDEERILRALPVLQAHRV